MIDKNTIQQVLGSIMKNPQILSQVDKYNLDITDFPTKFEKILFIAIRSLYQQGAKKITALDVSNCLELDKTSKAVFDANNGVEYLQDVEEFINSENFPYYYTRLKKLNLLNDLNKSGIKTNDIYCEDLTAQNVDEINQKFESLSIKDILALVKKKLLKLENNYNVNDDVQTTTAASGIRDLLSSLKEKDAIGSPIQGDIYTQVINGAARNT